MYGAPQQRERLARCGTSTSVVEASARAAQRSTNSCAGLDATTELAKASREQRTVVCVSCQRSDHAELSEQPIHATSRGEHPLFDGGRRSGVLDFDLVDVDACNIGWSMISDCG